MSNITQNITAPDRYMQRTTMREAMKSYKSARVRYEHRTIVQDAASLPGRIEATPIDSPRTFTRVFLSSGDETIQYRTNSVVAHSDAEVDTATAKYHLKIGEGGEAIWWNASTGQWQASLVINDVLLQGPLQKDADFIYIGFLFVTTGVVPAGKGPAIEAVIAVQGERVKTLKELVEVSRYFYEDFSEFEENAAKKHLRPVAAEPLALVKQKLAELPDWQLQPIHDAINAAAEQLGLGMGKVGMPMRVAVTGGGNSPALDQTLLLVGRDRTLARIELALEFISKRAEAS